MRLLGVEGRHCRDDVAVCARYGERWNQGGDYRAGAVRHAVAGGIAGGREGVAGGDGAVSEAAGEAGGVRAIGQADYRESDVEWRSDPVGWGDPDGPEVNLFYSWRRATNGSILAARRAGSQPARSATAERIAL